jgi:ElaB/YqjD/DUF883 family membrane-anchored ribosome-binding protein
MAASKAASPENSGPSATFERQQKTEAAAGREEWSAQEAPAALGKLDAKRERAADALERGAAFLHDKAEALPGGQKAVRFVHNAADKMESAAAYLRKHGMRDILADAKELVHKHPGRSLAVAAVAGFLAGRVLRRE